tara:strand:- start:5860 stop:6135 length:276 start_codon:yes stop_codon:yes gene_type:complete
MKLTKSRLKQIIKEELRSVLMEEEASAWCVRVSKELAQGEPAYSMSKCSRLWNSQCVGQDATKTASDVRSCAMRPGMDEEQLSAIGLRPLL